MDRRGSSKPRLAMRSQSVCRSRRASTSRSHCTSSALALRIVFDTRQPHARAVPRLGLQIDALDQILPRPHTNQISGCGDHARTVDKAREKQPAPPSASQPIDLCGWGIAVLRPTRERAAMTRAQLAQRRRVAAPTIRNIETVHHQPRRQTLQALCAALGLVNPLVSPERLRLPLAGVSRDRALALIAEALADFVRARSDARVFAERLCPRPGIQQFRKQSQAADDSEHGAALQATLIAEQGNR